MRSLCVCSVVRSGLIRRTTKLTSNNKNRIRKIHSQPSSLRVRLRKIICPNLVQHRGTATCFSRRPLAAVEVASVAATAVADYSPRNRMLRQHYLVSSRQPCQTIIQHFKINLAILALAITTIKVVCLAEEVAVAPSNSTPIHSRHQNK